MKMSGDQSRNVRLVKCPKCRKLLPESPNVPLYMCGGCGAVLQAKVRTKNAGGIPQIDLAQLNNVEQNNRIGSSGENVVSPAETSFLIQNDETSHDDSGSCTKELPEDRNVQIKVATSSELLRRSNSPSPETNATVEMTEERNFSNRAPSLVELTQYSSDLSSSPVTAASRDETIYFSGELPSSTELMHQLSDPLSPAMDASCKVDGVDDRTSVSRNGNTNQTLITSANSLIDSAETPSRDDVSSSLLPRPADEPQLNSRKNIAHLFYLLKSKLPMEKGEVQKSSKSFLQDSGHTQSTNTAEMEEIINPIPNLNDALRGLPTRSAYTYDGSISSDGTDDQLLYKHKRTFKNDEFIGDAVRADFPMSMSMERQSEIHQDAWSFSSSVDKRYPMRQSSGDSGELVEPVGYAIRNQLRMDVDKHPSNASSDPMGVRAKNEFGGPSNKQENPEQERLRLLRMVYDLQDQLHQIQVSQGESISRAPSTNLWSANHVPSYVNQEAAGKEMDHGSKYSSHLNERDGRWRNWAQYSTSSQMSFLGEASHSGLQVDPSCFCCNACSNQLPYPVCCCKEALHRVHLCPGEYSYSPPNCFLPGHCQYIESDIPQNFRDRKSGEQGRAEGYAKYEKPLPSHSVEHPFVKRHFLPIAGAAPFIACYICQNVLQLPADFLLFRKRFHKLRCGACSKILKFSLENNTHILPYFGYVDDLPSGELDSGSDAFYRGNYASGNELTSSSSHPDPISCSEDSGLLSHRSLSTEREQLRHLEGGERNRKISRSSLQSAEGRKQLISNQSVSATKSLFKSSSRSRMLNGKQFSSEIEEKSTTSNSPLHRLMGYSSISQVMRGQATIEKN